MTSTAPASRPRALAAAVLGAAVLAAAPAARAGGDAAAGRALFEQRCAACHSVGGGDGVGPDLAGVAERREAAWLRRMIVEPDRLLAEGDAAARELDAKFPASMPNLGISNDEADAIIAFLAGGAGAGAGGSGAAGAEAAAARTAPEGDPERGRRLFLGEERLSAGGPACRACHAGRRAGDIGGTLGPDLSASQAAETASRTFVEQVEPMKTTYAGRPLTEQEVADLQAYFAQARGATAEAPGSRLPLVGAVGAVLLLAVTAAAGRRRLGDVRRALVEGRG